MLRTIRLDDICRLPASKTFDTRFYVWPVGRFDVKQSSFNLDGNNKFPIRDHDMNLVLGLPWQGEPIARYDKFPLVSKRDVHFVFKIYNLDTNIC